MIDKKMIYIITSLILLVAVYVGVIVTKSVLLGACGCGALALGLIYFIIRSPKQKKDNIFSMIMLALLYVGVGISLYFQIKENDFKGKISTISLFALFMGIEFTWVVSYLLKKKRCNLPIEAVCSDIDVFESRSNDEYNRVTKTYAPVWEYIYEGMYFNETEKIHSNRCKIRKGDKRTIYIDPDYPEDFIGVNHTGLVKYSIIVCLVICAVFFFTFKNIIFN